MLLKTVLWTSVELEAETFAVMVALNVISSHTGSSENAFLSICTCNLFGDPEPDDDGEAALQLKLTKMKVSEKE
jgi:hypothetical protein